MKKSLFLFMLLASFLFIGCGKKQDAKLLVSAFLDNNLKNTDIGSISYSDLDSTIYINDSIVGAMHQQADTMKAFKPKIVYDKVKALDDTVLYIKVKFKQNNEKQTYIVYFDHALQHVLAIKRY